MKLYLRFCINLGREAERSSEDFGEKIIISIKVDSEGETFVQVNSEDSNNRKNTKPSLKVKDYSSKRINRI